MPYKDPEIARTFRSWHAMMHRCLLSREEHPRYHNIVICQRWRSFRHFLEDMGIRPVGTVLDRQENSQGYIPGNCRWVTYQQSTENRTNTVWLEHAGQVKRVAEWAVIKGLTPATIYQRLLKGLSVDAALSKPLRKNTPQIFTFNGRTMSLSAWARHLKIPHQRLRARLLYGWTFEDAISLVH